MAKKKMTPRGARIFGIGFAAFACIFIAVGGGMAWSQATKLTSWQPVAAKVVSSEVTSRHGSKGGTTYKPLVRFTYQVGGIEHSADTAMPIDMSTSGSAWAQRIVARFPAGSQTTAYYDPRSPGDAFLVREANVFPYLIILFPMVHVCIGVGVWWFAGRPGLDARSKARRMGAMAVVWDAVGVLAFVHYLTIGGGLDWTAGLAFGIYAALGTVLVLIWVHFLRKAAAAGRETTAAPITQTEATALPNRTEPENPFRRPD